MKANSKKEVEKFRLPRDSVTVYIPINLTADMRVITRRVRAKRVSQLRSLLSPTETGTLDTIKEAKEELENEDIDKCMLKERKEKPQSETFPRREQYSSILDYLEAKYVKGVMLEDTDVNHGRASRGMQGDAYVSDSEQSGSCYSNESGNFIDDSDLQTDIMQQVFASSAFGKTKLEALAKRVNKNETQADGIIHDDDAYFVNVGDLEMEDGWDDRLLLDRGDWMKRAMRQGKKRKRPASVDHKRSPKKVSVTGKMRPTIQKQDVQAPTVSKKKKTGTDDSFSKSKLKNPEKEKTLTKKMKSPEKGTEKALTKKVPAASSPSSTIRPIPQTSNENVNEALHQCDQLSKHVKCLYDQCVRVIKNLPENTWNRKQKKNTVKVSIKVPENKKNGDTILFSNPHIPGQKLKVQIPDKVVTGESFVVSVPMPNTEKTDDDAMKFHKLPKDLVVALYEYSMAYDEWTQSIAMHRSKLPDGDKNSLGSYKPGSERLKKFDELVHEFPSDLVPPIEIAFLRQVVRNEVKRRGKQNTGASQELNDKGLHCPEKGTHFMCHYNQADFI